MTPDNDIYDVGDFDVFGSLGQFGLLWLVVRLNRRTGSSIRED